MADRDRLNSHLKRQAMHNILIVVFGFIVLIVIAIAFGPKLLINYSLLMEKFQGDSSTTSTTTQQSDTYVAPPTLDTIPTATNKQQITITGIGQKNQTISLYVNNQLVDKQSVDDNNKFKFSNVALQSGQNTIQTKAEMDNNESGFSNTNTISYLKNPPSLSITQPQDGQTISKSSSPSVNIQGQTNAGADAKVTVNGFWAIVDNTGKYSYLYTLQDGSNDIKVVVTDAAGNQTTKEIHINAQ